MSTARLTAAALLLFALPATGQEPAPAPADDATALEATGWMVRVARMEGASVGVEDAATKVAATARAIADSGRIQSMSRLSAEVHELQRKATSARLAARVLDQPLD